MFYMFWNTWEIHWISNTWDIHVLYMRKYMRNTWEIHGHFTSVGGAERYEDIDIFEFYAKHGPNMLVVEPIIREMLSQPAGSYSPEKVFSGGKFVINDYRTSLDPARAEGLIVSAARFKMKLSSKYLPSKWYRRWFRFYFRAWRCFSWWCRASAARWKR